MIDYQKKIILDAMQAKRKVQKEKKSHVIKIYRWRINDESIRTAKKLCKIVSEAVAIPIPVGKQLLHQFELFEVAANNYISYVTYYSRRTSCISNCG